MKEKRKTQIRKEEESVEKQIRRHEALRTIA
jgi:hypothetical protein